MDIQPRRLPSEEAEEELVAPDCQGGEERSRSIDLFKKKKGPGSAWLSHSVNIWKEENHRGSAGYRLTFLSQQSLGTSRGHSTETAIRD